MEDLKAIGYGSDRFDGALTTFWVNGDLEISPLEQFEFLQRLSSGRIPVDPQHVETRDQLWAKFTALVRRKTEA